MKECEECRIALAQGLSFTPALYCGVRLETETPFPVQYIGT